MGFGNIFARALGHRASIPFLLELLGRGQIRRAEVGVDATGVFLSSRSFGFLEAVKQSVENRHAVPRSALLRYLAYLRVALRMLRTLPLPSIRVVVEGALLAADAAVAIVANVPTYQGFLPLTPLATPFDGALDVFVVPRVARAALVSLLLAFLVRLPQRWRRVVYWRGTQVVLGSHERAKTEVAVLRAALPVLAPSAPASPGHATSWREAAAGTGAFTSLAG